MDAKNNDNYVASPKYTWNYLNEGIDDGVNSDSCLTFLNKYGSVSWDDDPQNNLNFEWYDNSLVATSELYDKLKVKVSQEVVSLPSNSRQDTAITAYNDSDLDVCKNLLREGYILGVTTYCSFREVTLNNDVHIALYVRKFDSTEPHAMTIVGYDDSIYYDMNGDSIKQDYEYGAFLVANSWGVNWKNSGFIWVMYDALNRVSNVNEYNDDVLRIRFSPSNNCNYMKVETQPVDLAVEVTIGQTVRNDFNIYVGCSSEDVMGSSIAPNTPCETINKLGGALNFDGTNSNEYQTRKFLIDCSEMYQQNKLGKFYWVYVEDDDVTNASDTYIEEIRFVSGGKTLGSFSLSINVCELATEESNKAGWYYSIFLDSIPVAQLEVSPLSKKLAPGESVLLTASTTPSEAINHSIQWTSSNESVATVNSSGVVTANGVGYASITATALGGVGVTDTCLIAVDDHVDIVDNSASSVTLDTPISGRIDLNEDIDCLIFTPTVSGNYVFYSTGTTNIDGAVYDSSGSLLLQNKDMSSTNTNFAIPISLTAGTTYYLMVQGNDNTTNGEYEVVVTENNYSLNFTNKNQDARCVTFGMTVSSLVDTMRVTFDSTTYVLNKSTAEITTILDTKNCFRADLTYSADGKSTTWVIKLNVTPTNIGSSSSIRVMLLAGNVVLASNLQVRGIVAYGSSYKTNLTPGSYVSSLLSSMATTGYTFTAYKWDDTAITATTTTKVATGTKIVQRNSSGKIIHVYYLVLFGDVTGSGVVGDGLINANDSLKVLQEVEETFMGAISKLAADANHDGTIAQADADLILEHAVSKATINQNYTISDAVSEECYFKTAVAF